MPDINYRKYLEMISIAEVATKNVEDLEIRCIAFEKVLDDLLMRFYSETYDNQKGDK